MFQTDALVYKALVHQLLQEIGKGPWSNDPGQFGKQVREVITTAINRGLKLSIDDTSRGSEVTMEEQWDEGNFDPVGEYVESVDGEAAAVCETMQRQRAADIANFLLDVPAVPMSDMPVVDVQPAASMCITFSLHCCRTQGPWLRWCNDAELPAGAQWATLIFIVGRPVLYDGQIAAQVVRTSVLVTANLLNHAKHASPKAGRPNPQRSGPVERCCED